MATTTASLLGAAGLAIFLSGVELTGALNKPLSLRACHWVALRLLVDGATAALALVILTAVFAGLTWFTGVWPAIIAGLAGPALVRSQLAVIGSGQESSYYGPANVFVRLQKTLDRMIDIACSTEHAPWIARVAIPQIAANCTLEELAQTAKSYVKSISGMSPQRRRTSIRYVQSVLDDTVGDPEKIASIVQHLVDIGGLRLVKRLAKR